MKKLHVVTVQQILTYRVTVETNSSAEHFEKQDAVDRAVGEVSRYQDGRPLAHVSDSVANLGTSTNAEIVASVPIEAPA